MAKEDEGKTVDDCKAAEEGAQGAAQAPDGGDGAGDDGSAGGTPGEDGEDLRDPHGQPGIAKGKYEREIAERDRRIAELEARVAESAKTEEGRKSLADSIEALKAEMADKDVTHALEMAGCVNTKAAKAVLADFEGDVAKLREACPYLG